MRFASGLTAWALFGVSFTAWTKVPDEYANYAAAVQRAEMISDPAERCMAYPALPQSSWPQAAVKARCDLVSQAPLPIQTIKRMAKTSAGAKKLDSLFREELNAHYANGPQREQIVVSYESFNASPEAEQAAKAWLTKLPTSPYAKTALGKVYAAEGWEARGTGAASDVPEEKMRAMEAHFAKALPLLGSALSAEPRLLPACIEMSRMGRAISKDLQLKSIHACQVADPNSYFVVSEMRNAAEPRWGGSIDELKAVDAYAAARAKRFPLLYAYTESAAGYGPVTSNDDGRIAVLLEQLAKTVPQVRYLRESGCAYLRVGDSGKALVLLSQAVRIEPTSAQSFRCRADALRRLGELDWALRDAKRAVSLEPNDAMGHFVLALVLDQLNGRAAALPEFKAAARDPDYRKDVERALAKPEPSR